jgi:hypothetical protein
VSGRNNNSRSLPNYTGLQVQTSALNVPITIMWGRNRISFNLIWWNDFTRTPQHVGKGGGKGAQSFNYSVAALMGLCWGQVSSVPTVYTNQAKTTLANLGLTLFNGTAIQSPFGYIVTNHPTQALSYPNVAYLASSKLALGATPTLPSIAVEVVGNLSGTMPGTDDANPGDIVPDFLTNPLYGMGILSGEIDADSLATYKTYCQAQGIFMSPVLTQQEKASQIIDRWAALSNSWIYWSGTSVKFVPLGDQAITANGATYTPNTAINYDLTVAHFTTKTAPVSVQRTDRADAFNRTRIEIKDRALDYNSNPIEYKDQTSIDQFGVVDNNGVPSGNDIVDAGVALTVVTLMGKRAAYLLNGYTFKTVHNFVRLEPGDLVTITDPTNPAVQTLPVRIVDVECAESGELTFTAEDYPGVIGRPQAQTVQAPTAITFDHLVAPGDVNAPCVFEPNSALNNGVAQIWIALSGGAYWGGGDVYISLDNSKFEQIGSITGKAKQGVLTATLASHADPDSTNTLSIDLAQSAQQLVAVTHADADAFRTLSYLVPQPSGHVINTAGELVAYGTATSTGTYTDDLTYLRRALYGTAAASHPSADQFTLLDLGGASGSLLKYTLPPAYIGQTVYLRFASFNIYGQSTQDYTTLTSYTYSPTGLGYGGGTAGEANNPDRPYSNGIVRDVDFGKLELESGDGQCHGIPALSRARSGWFVRLGNRRMARSGEPVHRSHGRCRVGLHILSHCGKCGRRKRAHGWR